MMTPPPSQPPHSHSSKRKPRILLGVTGSVATVKIPQLALCLIEQLHVDVRIVLTHGAQYFWNSSVKTYDPISWERLMNKWKKCQETKHNFMGDIKDGDDSAEGELYLHEAQEEWKDWNEMGDPILHINLRSWADLALIAPLSAHTLGKLSNGLCDDPLSSCMRAWEFSNEKKKPVILAPAMNTAMYVHPLTRMQLRTIQGFWKGKGDNDDLKKDTLEDLEYQNNSENGVWIVKPQSKMLACGEIGDGALASVEDIVSAVEKCLKIFYYKS